MDEVVEKDLASIFYLLLNIERFTKYFVLSPIKRLDAHGF
jgi:hypothetical protein